MYLFTLVLLVAVGAYASDKVIYDQSHSTECVEVSRQATRDCRWGSSLDPRLDEYLEKGRIIAYKLRWFGGSWSGWFVPGQNDVDIKFNPQLKTTSCCNMKVIKNFCVEAFCYLGSFPLSLKRLILRFTLYCLRLWARIRDPQVPVR